MQGPQVPEDGQAAPPSLPQIIEAIFFSSQKPVSAREIAGFCAAATAAVQEPGKISLPRPKPPEIEEAVNELALQYQAHGRAFEIRASASGWQLVTKPEFAPWVRQLFPENRPARLSSPALETLAIIAYRQPVTRADIEAVRGVAVDGVVQTLLDRGLIKIAGRAEVPGRPLLYETTQHFLDHFGVRDVSELPNAGELRAAPLPTATPEPATPEPATPEPATMEPGLPEVPDAQPESAPAAEDRPDA